MKTIPTAELNAVTGGHQSPFGPTDPITGYLGDFESMDPPSLDKPRRPPAKRLPRLR